MPRHLSYVEPYAGGLAVLLAKNPEGISEVVNDLHSDLLLFWSVLRSEDLYPKFVRLCEATPFSEFVWQTVSQKLKEDRVEKIDLAQRAWMFFVACRQSLAGRMRSFTGITKTRTRRGMNNEVSAWLSAVEGLPAVHERLKRVLIVGPKPALQVIEEFDTIDTCTYIDPPYLPETVESPDVYQHGMTRADHIELLKLLKSCKSKILLSGYPSELYSSMLRGWRCMTFDIANHSAGGKLKERKQECVWMNYYPSPRKG